jgi:DNA-binding protein H-NS
MTTTPNSIPKEQTRPNGQAAGPPKLASSPDAEGASPAGPNLTALADDVLADLVAQGQAEILRRKQKKEADFLALVAETARTLGLSPSRVAAAISQRSQRPRASAGSDGRHDVKPVYRDPVSGATWSGRGQPPPFIEFGDEVSPKTGKKVPLRRFWIAEQET